MQRSTTGPTAAPLLAQGPTSRAYPAPAGQHRELVGARAGSARAGRIPWPPRGISGEEAQARARVFLGITHNEQRGRHQVHRGEGAPRALCGKSRTPRPQSAHEHGAREADESGCSCSRGLLSAIHNRNKCRFLQATSDARKPAPHLVPGRSPPAGSAEGRSG
jgi:hypothetical protein